MKRREFSQLVGVGLVASSLPVALAACQTEPPSASGSAPSSAATGDFIAIGTVAELDAAGVLANDAFNGTNVAVIRDPADPDTLVAVDARCTHAGCTVDWSGDRGLFICPCHGSQFGADGSAQSGPARDPLPRYEAIIENDQVLVKV